MGRDKGGWGVAPLTRGNGTFGVGEGYWPDPIETAEREMDQAWVDPAEAYEQWVGPGKDLAKKKQPERYQ